MELPNRYALQGDFAERLGALTTRQRQRLRELMGDPPNPSNVPESFWIEVEREAQAEMLAALYLIFLEAGAFHGGNRLALDSDATAFALYRSATTAGSYAKTARSQFGTLAGKMLRPGQFASGPNAAPSLDDFATREITLEVDLDDALAKIFGASKAESMAVDGTTAAQTAGGEAAIESTWGRSPDDLWINQPHLSESGPCEICEPLNGVPRSQWPEEYFDGPGDWVHPRCVCIIEYANMPGSFSAA